MKTIYFQMFCGASGDMVLSSMIDLGVEPDRLNEALKRTGIEGLDVRVEKVTRGGVSCSHMLIDCGSQKEFRHLADIREIIARGGYSPRVVANADCILKRLARAEAAVHGIAMEQVHFHEIGAVDTIVDVLGTCLCLEFLGVDEILFSGFTTGHGTIKAQHGIMPNPAPATAELICGFEIAPIDIEAEILTPTGAAILTALGRQCGILPAGKVLSAGYGCGDRVFEKWPNCIRALLLETEGPAAAGEGTDLICELVTDLDDISGEVMGFSSEEILAGKALDVSWTPVFMKKGRPGYRLTVLCRPEDKQAVASLIIANTRTLGVRYRLMERFVADREPVAGKDGDEEINLKKCSYGDTSFTKAEYESLARLARKRNIPLINLDRNRD